MADNLTTQSGTLATVPASSVIATDDAGANGHVQLVKLAISTDGSATALTADNTDGLLVNLGGNNDVTLATLPDTGAGDLAAINAAVSGTLTVGSHAVTNAGTFAVQEDGAALTALQLIDDAVYVDDVPFTAGGSKVIAVGFRFDDVAVDTITEGDVGYARISSRREIYTTIRDAAGNERGLNVDANGDIGVTNANLSTLAGAVAGSEVQVDIVSGNVTNAGTFAVQVDGSALTALQLIDDVVFTDDAAFTPASSKVAAIGAVFDDTATDVVDEGDIGAVRMSNRRALYTTFETPAGDSPWDDTNDALQVNIVAGSASGTEYTEDAAAAANPAGGAVILVRADTPAGITTTDGDNVAQRGTDYGAAFVQVLDSSGNFINSFGGSGGTSHADDAAFSIGSASSVTPTAYLADETTPDSVDEGDVGVPRMTLTRKPYAVITDASSENNAAVDGSGHLQVDIAADSVGIGGGTQYAVDAALGATPTGTLAVGIRDDALSALTPVEGDAVGLRVDANGALWVIPSGTVTVDNGGTFVVQEDGAALTALQLIDDAVYVDDADWTDTTSKHLLVGGLYQSVPQTVTDGDVAPFQVDSNGNIIEANSAAILADTANMDTNLGTVAGAVSGSEMQVDVVAALPTGDNNIGNVDIVTLPASTNTIEVVGDVAADAAAAGNPVLIGASHETMADSAPSNRVSTDADASRVSVTDGAIFAIPTGPQTWSYHSDGSAALTDATVHAAPGANLSLYVTDIVFSSGAATAINAFFEESTTKVLGPYYLEAVAGRGVAIHFGTPKKITANTALTVTTSAAIAHSVDVTGFIAPG